MTRLFHPAVENTSFCLNTFTVSKLGNFGFWCAEAHPTENDTNNQIKEINMDNNLWVTTAFDFQGYKNVRHLGVVRGVTVRSRSVVGNFVGGLQTLVGGNITVFTELCEHARQEAFDLMVQHARQLGANAIIGMRYDANDVMDGVTEVLAYGTAVVIEKA
jgi:uncharacterized protein YbjQ (UPF0145 family)